MRIALIAAVFLAVGAATARAVIYVDSDLGVDGDGTSWARAHNNLQSALTGSNPSSSNPIEIWLKRGVYKPATTADRTAAFVLHSYTTIRGGFVGTESSPAQRPAPTSATAFSVLSGDIGVFQPDGITATTNANDLLAATFDPTTAEAQDNSYNVVRAVGATSVTLDEVVVAGGCANSTDISGVEIETMLIPVTTDAFGFQQDLAGGACGGAVFATNSDLTVTHCWFIGNFAQGLGGAIAMRGGSLNLEDSQFGENVSGYGGGGVSIQDTAIVAIDRNLFESNSSAFVGGGLFIQSSADNHIVSSYEGTALIGLATLTVNNSIPPKANAGASKVNYSLMAVIGDSLGVAQTFGQIILEKKGLLSPSLTESPLTLYADEGLADAMSGAYGWVCFAEVGVDLGVQIALALGADPNDPFIQAWTPIAAAFNAYATPLGLAETIYNLIENFDAPGLAERMHNLRLQEFAEDQNPANQVLLNNNRFDSNFAAGFGGGAMVVRTNVIWERSYFTSNEAGYAGGAASSIVYNNVDYENSAFLNNLGDSGDSGVLGAYRTINRLVNDTLVGNVSTVANGFAVRANAGADISLVNCVLWGNTGGDVTSSANPNRLGGADLFATRRSDLDAAGLNAYSNAGDSHGMFTGIIDVQYSDVQSLARLAPGGPIFYPSAPPLSYDLEGANVANGFPNVGEGIRATWGNISRDPMLLQGVFLQIASPLINAGSPATFQKNGSYLDLVGTDRNDGHVDIGAIESNGSLPTGTTLYVNSAAAASGNGLSWSGAFKTLPEAFAVPLSPGCAIWVAQGTYYPTSSNDRTAALTLTEGVSLIGSLPVGATAIAQSDPTHYPTVISGEIGNPGTTADNSYVLLRGTGFTNDPDVTSTLPRLIIGVRFTGANSNEAAVHLAVPATIQNCTFDHNAGARALWIEDPGIFAYNRTTQITDCTFDTNTAGALDYNASQVALIRCDFYNNTATDGAAVRQEPSYTIQGSLKLERCILAFNNATAGRGGAVRTNVPDLSVAQTDIVYNTALPAGGDTGTQGGAGLWWDVSDHDAYYAAWQTINSIFYGNRLSSGAPAAALEFQQFGIADAIPDYYPGWSGRTFQANDLEGLDTLAVLGGTDGNVDYDPIFVNSAGRNFALQNTSPLINLGTLYSSGSDAQAVVVGSAPDIGALENAFGVSSLLPIAQTVALPTTAGRVYTLSFTVSGSLSYTWQVRRAGTSNWVTVTADSYTSGVGTATLTITNPPTSWDGSLYRLIYNGGTGPAYTTTLALSVQPSILYVKTVASGLADGSSWANAMTLPAALQVAAPFTNLWLASGSYVLTTSYQTPLAVPAGVRLYGGFAGTETVFAQRPVAGAATVLGSNLGFQLFSVTGTATWTDGTTAIPTIFDGLTMGPPAVANASDDELIAESANTVFNHVTFTCPWTAVRVHNGQAAFTGGSFTHIGAVALDLDSATVQVSACHFVGNGVTTAGLAGAIQGASATINLADSTFSANHGHGSGAIYSAGASGGLTIQRCQFTDNVSGTAGGAVFVANTLSSRIANSLFGRDSAAASGGAVATQNGGVTFAYCTFAANTAPYGAAIDAGGPVQLTDSIVWDNVGTSPGSHDPAANGSITSTNSTVQGSSPAAPLFDPNSIVYALSANSPLLNTGETDTSISGTTDLLGQPRHYSGGAADPGATEYQGAPGTPVYLTTEPANVSLFAQAAAAFSVAGNVGSTSGGASFDWQYWNGSAWAEASGLAGATVTPGTNGSTLTFASAVVAESGLQLRATAAGIGAVSYATLTVIPRKVIYVVNGNAGPNLDGLSWATAWPNIDTATFYADANTDIWIEGGDYDSYDATQLVAGAEVYVGFAGTETSSAQADPVAHPVRIQFGAVFIPLVPTVANRLPVIEPPIFLSQVPSSLTTTVEAAVSFAAQGAGSSSQPLTWQYLVGSTWTPIANLAGWTVTQSGDGSTLSEPAARLSDSGLQVRVVYPFYNEYSSAATLTAQPRPILYVNAAVSASGNGTTWALAFKTIGEAISAATPTTDIWIAGGDYPFGAFAPPVGTQFYVGFAGGETDVNARNPGAHPVYLAGPASLLTLVPTSTAALPAETLQIAAASSNAAPYVSQAVSFTAQSVGPSAAAIAWEYYNGSAWVSISGLSGWYVTAAGNTSTLANSAVPEAQNGTQIRAGEPGDGEVSIAATLTVKPRVTRYVNGNVAASGDGTAWASAFKTIGEALAVADSGTDIWIVGGNYPQQTLTIVPGAVLYGGFTGTETVVTARDGVANPVRLQGFGSTVDLTAAVANGLTYNLASPPRPSPVYIGQPAQISITRAGGSTATLTWQYYDGSQWQPITGLSGWTVQTNGSLSTIVNSAVPSAQNGTPIRVSVDTTSELSFVTTLSVANRTTLYVDTAVAAPGNGTAWTSAFKTLAGALAVANSGTDIWIAQGTYVEPTHSLAAGAKVYGGFASGDATLGARSPSTHPVILRSSGAGSIWSIDLSGLNSAVGTVIDGVTLDGLTSSAPAVSLTGGTAQFSNVTFSGNTTALSTTGSTALTIDTCSFSGNAAGLLIAAGPSVTVTNSTFTGGAGAIQSASGVALLVSGSTLANQSSFGIQAAPGIGVESSGFSGSPTALVVTGSGTAATNILHTTFANHPTAGVQSAAPVTITDGTFSGCAIGLSLTGSAATSTLAASHFSGNTDAVDSPAGLAVMNSVFTLNVRGLVFSGSAGGSAVTGSQFTQNTTGIVSTGGLAVTGGTFASDTTGIALAGGTLPSTVKSTTFTGEVGTAVTSTVPVTLDTDTFTNCAAGATLGSGVSTITNSNFTGTTGTAIGATAGVTVTNNTSISGGATGLTIAAAAAPATSTIAGTTFSGLTVAGITAVDSVTLTGDTFTGCALGVGITGGTLQVGGTTFQNGVAGLNVAYPASLVLTGSIFSGNSGLGVNVVQQTTGGADTLVSTTQFLNNTGQLFNQSQRSFVFDRCTVTGNTNGGALIANSAGSASFVNTLVAHNTTASSAPLAIGGSARVISCTLADNYTGTAVGVVSGQFLYTVTQSILWGNRSSANVGIETMQVTSAATVTYSVIEQLSTELNSMPAAHNSGLDPLFIAAPSGNYTLNAYSAAIDAGGANATGDSLDLAGNARVQSTAIDLGALESPYTLAAQPLDVTYTPSSPSLVTGSTGTLNVGFAVSTGVTIRWQYNSGAGWVDLASNSLETSSYANGTLTLTLTGDFSIGGRSYRAVIAENGVDVYSTPAALLTVTSPITVYVDHAAAGTGDGTSWANAYTSLVTALNATPAFSNILVAAGTYAAPSGGSLTLRNNQHLLGAYTAGTSNRDPVNTPTNLTSAAGYTASSIILASTNSPSQVTTGTLIDGFAFELGGIGLKLTSASAAIQNCRFQSLATGISLSAVSSSVPVVVAACSFAGQTASAIRVTGGTAGNLQISASTFANNTTAETSIGGGAISLGDLSQPQTGAMNLVMTDSTFTGNSAAKGGAIAFGAWSSTASITRCTFTGNATTGSSGRGGAISEAGPNQSGVYGLLTVRDSLLAGNTAPGANGLGAAINSDSPVTLAFVTIAGNTGGQTASDGAVTASDGLVLRDCILWGNLAGATAVEGAQMNITGATDYADSIVQNLQKASGTRLLPFDPRFVDSAHGNYQLGADSPAIGIANPADLLEDEADVLGVARPAGAAPDLGAYETAAVPAPVYVLNLPASVPVYAGTNFTFPTELVPPGYTGTWQYYNGTAWVAMSSGSGPAGAEATSVTNTPANHTSVLTFTGIQATLDGTPIRFVLTTSASTYLSTSAAISILPFQTIYVDASRTASGDGTSWATAFPTVTQAVSAISSSARVIEVAEGTYSGSVSYSIPQHVTLYGGFPAGGSDLASRNPAAHPTILSGLNADGVTRATQVVSFVNTGDPVQAAMDGFTIANGQIGVLCSGFASPTLSNLVVTGNNNTGLVIQNSSAVVQDCRFENNTGTNGGGIAVTGASTSPTFDRIIVRGNTGTLGGGMYLSGSITSVVRDSLLTGNLADTGGAIYSGIACPLIQVTLAGNRARLAPAVYGAQSFSGQISNSIVWGNRATQGDATAPFAALNLTGSTFTFDQVVAEEAPIASTVLSFDPLFVSPADAALAPTTAGDYRLRVVSPAIDAGSNSDATGLTLDVASQPRFVGTVDLGAYEYPLTGLSPLLITSSPASIAFHSTLSNTFSVIATGGVSFVWQYAAPNGGTWVSVDGVAGFSGALTSTLTVTAATIALNGYRFRALVTGADGSVVTSGAATLSAFPTRYYVNAGRSGTDAGDGLSWATSFRSLDAAIAAAPDDPQGTEIWLAAGNYTPATSFALRNGLLVYGGFAGTESVLTDRNPTLNVTALVAATGQPAVILTSLLSDNPLSLRLDGLTVRDSSDSSQGVNNQAGCSIDFEGVKFTGLNSLLSSPQGTLNFRHVEARGNGLGIITAGGSVLIENMLFAGNSSGGTAGSNGIPMNVFGGPTVIRQSTFAGNQGIPLHFDSSSNQTYNCVFWGNSAAASFDVTGQVGVVAGNVIQNLSTVQARASSFTNNTADDPMFPVTITPSIAPSTAGTFTLGSGSLAIDTGINAQTSSSNLDLAGNPRQAGLDVDPGAYEYQGNDVYSITAQPASVPFLPSAGATFTVGVSHPATYTWEASTDGTSFTPIPGATSATLTVPASNGAAGYSYRAVVQFTTGPQMTSNAASLMAVAVLASEAKPAGFTTPAQFSATASVAVTAWQWQVSSDGLTFVNVASATGSTLQVSGGPSSTNLVYRVQATLADSSAVSSNAVAFTYADAVPSPASTLTGGAGFALAGGVLSSSLNDAALTVRTQFGGRLLMGAGALTPTINGSDVSFNLTYPPAAGSSVSVTTTTALLRADGVGSSPQVWEYQVPTVSGQGVFGTPVTLSANAATTLAAGDLDGNGTIDLIVADTGGLRVWRNNGLGAFTADASAFGAAGARAIALGSLTGGTALDAAVVTAAGDVQIWTNSGAGVFTLAQTIAGISARAIALGDLDADGDLDLFVTTANGNRVYFNNGAAAFTLGSTFDSVAGTSVALGDFDGDGALDAIVTSSTTTTVWANDGLGGFTSAYSAATPADRVAVADLDDDGLLDAILTRAGQPARLWHNTGNFQFTTVATLPGGGAATLAAGDVDGDGRADLILTDATGATAAWITQSSLASTVEPGQSGLQFGTEVTLADLDNDGALDLVGIDASGHPAVALYHVTPTEIDAGTTTTLQPTGFTPAPTNVQLVTLPAHGTLLNGTAAVNVGDSFTAGAAAELTYQPTGNYSGLDAFTWSATPGGAVHSYGILVLPVVTANPDAIALTQGGTATTLVGSATSVLANDLDATVGSTLSASVVTGPAHGGLTLNADGTFIYVHDNTATPTDSFVYRATDPTTGQFADATVTITIANAPTAIALAVAPGTHYTGQAAGITVGTLSGTDPDPGDAALLTFTLVSGTGAAGNSDFTIVGNALVTADAINATAGLTRSIRVRATDPSSLSYDQVFTVSFTQAPTALAASVSTPEGTALGITLAGAGGATALAYTVATAPAQGTLSGTAPNLTYTPGASYAGADAFTFTVSDGTLTSAPANVAITVLPVNVAPTLAAISSPATIFVNAGVQTVNLTGIGAGGTDVQTLTVTATSNNTALIPNPTVAYTSPGATGSLSYTPAANATGTAVITVTVQDDGGTANGGIDTVVRTFTVTVASAVNVAPTLDAIGAAAIFENAAAQTVNLTGISAGGTDVQALTVTATSNNTALIPNPTVSYTSPNATGSLAYTPVTNAIGTAMITVTLMDNGGTANGGVNTVVRTFTVTVTKVNVAPTLNAISNQIGIAENSGQQSASLQGMSAGSGDTGQTYTVTATSSNPGKLANPTIILFGTSGNGILQYNPTAAGTFTITVTIQDNGGTANGGIDTFARTFTVTISPVNDPNIPTLKVAPRLGGGVTLQLGGTQNASYGISYSTDLLNWSPLIDVITDPNGSASLADPTLPSEGAARFYRALRN